MDPLPAGTHRPKSPKMRLNGHPVGKNRFWWCVWAILRGGNHLKWGLHVEKVGKVGKWVRVGKVSTDSRFRPSSPRYGHLSVAARRTHPGPK